MQLIAHDSPAAQEAALHIDNDADLAQLAASGALQGVQRINLHFPAFTDGRAFSQAVLLRRRYGFAGDLRATGDVLVDQLPQMARSGFSSAVLAPGQNLDSAQRQLQRYSAYYQGDTLQPSPLFARSPGASQV